MKKLLFSILLFSIITGCSSKGDPGVDDLFIPNVSNQWKSDRNSSFFINPDETDVNESVFTGHEQIIDESGETNFQYAGHFKNYDIDFTFSDGPEAGVKYTGKFIKGSNPLQIKATGSNGKKVVLTQQL